MGRNERGRLKAERQYSSASRDDLQRSKWFIRRRDNVCSIACQQKAEAAKDIVKDYTLTR
jgi:hypothetical protein